jgi:Arc/MetJ-type ribon-helix-helix transcriptional regulator
MVAIPRDPTSAGSAESVPDIRAVLDLVRRLVSLHQSHRTTTYEANLQSLLRADLGSAEELTTPRSFGRARKVSVSLPEELTATLQQRLGKGEFSQYVTEAVSRQLQLDLLAELSELFEAEDGPVPEELLEEARLAWPDAH